MSFPEFDFQQEGTHNNQPDHNNFDGIQVENMNEQGHDNNIRYEANHRAQSPDDYGFVIQGQTNPEAYWDNSAHTNADIFAVVVNIPF